MKDDKKVPQLRFPEFTDAWKQRKLSESAKFSKGNGYSKSDVTTKGIPLVLYGRLYTNYETVISNIDTYSELKKDGSVVSKGGEILVPASGETAEDISRASVIKDSGVLIGGDLNIIYPSNDIIPSFLALTITNGNIHKEMTKLAQGKTVVHLHNSDLSKIRFYAPTYNEQIRITEIFSNIDSNITLQQRKLNSLQKLKKGLLQKMFPKNGENIPEIRFPEFSDAWKQRKVGDLLVERREMVTKDNEYPLMAFIANEGVAPKGDRFDRSALVKNADSKKYKRTKYGDFIYSSNNLESGSIGLNKYGKASISPVYSIFYPTNLADSDFIGRYFLRKDFIGQMIRWRQGVVYGQWKIPEADFLNIDIYIPSKDEQEKIGQILDKVDNTITLQQRWLFYTHKQS